MKQWFVAYTQPLKESIAKQHLLDQGFEVYMPRFKKTRRHARKIQEVLAPLFPRYIFIAMDLDQACWRSVNGTRGVAYILMNQDKPATVPNDIIDSLQAQETADGSLAINSIDLFKTGDKVRVLEGPFKDHTAVFAHMDDQQRVQLLLNILGRETSIALPNYAIEAA